MKTITLRIYGLKSFLFIFSLILFGCNEEADNLSTNNVSYSMATYTGEQMFSGVFFAQGEFAKTVPTIKNSSSYYEIDQLTEEQKIEVNNKVEEILSAIKAKKPDYFENFKEKIESNDHLLIQETLIEGSKLIYETSVDLFLSKTEKEELEVLLADTDISTFVNSDGSINYELFKNEVSKKIKGDYLNRDECAVVGIVLVAAAYVVVVHGVATMTYVGVAWMVEFYAAVDQQTAVTRGELRALTKNITGERLINDLALMEFN